MAISLRFLPFPAALSPSDRRPRLIPSISALWRSNPSICFSIPNQKRSQHRDHFLFLRCSANGYSSSLRPGSVSVAPSDSLTSSLERVEVFDLDGKAVSMVDLWRDRKAVIAFTRHFGCVLCRKRADLLASKKDLMDAAGAALVLIGPGSVSQAKTFVEQTKFKGEVYADPNYSSYDALSFVSGVFTTFTPSAGLKIIQLYMEGYRQDWNLSFEKETRTKGGWQQGGILIAGPGISNISYLHKDKEAGDDPDIEDVVKACCL